MNGDEALAAYVRRLRAMKILARDAAKEAAPLVESVVKEQAAAGTDQDGKSWPPKKDGSRALPDAAAAVSAAAAGARIVVSLVGGYVFHDRSKGKFRRSILPDAGAGIPARILEALERGAANAFRKVLKR